MTAYNTTNGSNFLKVLYPDGPETLWYPKCPFAAWATKRVDFEGSSIQTNPLYAGIRGSHTFQTALLAKSTPQHTKFNVTRIKSYVIGSIDNEMLMASRSKKGGIVESVKVMTDSAMYEWGRMMARDVWNRKGGARGQVGSVATTRITLKDVNDAIHFEVGMELVSSETDGTSGSLQAGSGTITAIDRDNGYLDSDSNWTAQIAALDADDYLFREGDFGVAASGVLEWIPVTAPTAGDNHFGVDRSVDVVRLAGIRQATSGDIESTVFDGSAKAAINGADNLDTLWMNNKRGAELRKSLQAKSFYQPATVKSSDGKVGFESFIIHGENGPISVMMDPNCPYSYGLLTKREAWVIASLGELPHFETFAGDRFFVETSSDGKEFRVKGYFNVICMQPLNNVLLTF